MVFDEISQNRDRAVKVADNSLVSLASLYLALKIPLLTFSPRSVLGSFLFLVSVSHFIHNFCGPPAHETYTCIQGIK